MNRDELLIFMDEWFFYRLSSWLSFLLLLIVQKKPKNTKRFALGSMALDAKCPF